MSTTPSHSEPSDLSSSPNGDVALFIDWENFKYSLYEIGQMPDANALMQAVKERYGRPTVARAYADWQDYYHRKSFDQMSLYHAGIEPVYVPSRRNTFQQDRIKNSVDVKMSLDCLEVSFTNPHVRTYVLVAGDADFLHVAGLLRRRGSRVVMVGVTGSTSQRLDAAVDELVYYDTEIHTADSPRLPIEESAPPAVPPPAVTSPAPAKQATSLEAAVQIVIRLVREQREQEDGRNYPPLLSWLGIQMRSRAPDFSPQKHGFPKFKDFICAVERQGDVKIETQGLADRVWLPEDQPAQEEPSQSSPAESLLDAEVTEIMGGLAADELNEMADIVLTADDIENSHREYMAKTLLGRFLYNKGHWDPAALPSRAAPLWSQTWQYLELNDILRLIEVALDKGLLFKTTYADAYTGYEKDALELNRAHLFVRKVLALPTAD